MSTQLCRCGHPQHTHQHFRRGSDCSQCDCARFRGGLSAFLARLTRRRPRDGQGPRPQL